MEHMERKLAALWAEYKGACPDPEPGANFMPELWQRIEAHRQAALSLMLRRWVEACVVAALALALVVSTLLIPRALRMPVYQSTYLDVLAEADSSQDAIVLLPAGDVK